jgi:hypothetical protein
MLRVKEVILSEDILYFKMKDYCVVNSSYLPSIVFGLLLTGDHSVGTPCMNLINLSNNELAYNLKGMGFFHGGKAAGT